jgi:hypothetical protein
MTAPPHSRVPHLRDSFIVAKPEPPAACCWGGTVGIVRSTTAPAHLHPAAASNAEILKSRERLLMPVFPQSRVPHPLQPYRKGWVIERSETALNLHPAETSKVEVD